jgi:hypothetical protein
MYICTLGFPTVKSMCKCRDSDARKLLMAQEFRVVSRRNTGVFGASDGLVKMMPVTAVSLDDGLMRVRTNLVLRSVAAQR